ncbi:polysaccharide pyruvyl transferase family protein [Peribacillus simplex]|uniref:polysaccharide pyruvyl transferase family protein n=1 Tax=Peribacillus simplex TaxID=1478 RepID=UPI003D2843B1
MKRLLVDAYCNKNLGDDLFLKILFERYNNVNFTILNAPKEYKGIFKGIDIQNTNKIQRILFRLFPFHFTKKFEGFLLIGGSMFMQNETWKKDIKKKTRVINSFTSEKKEVFILGSNFGPFNDSTFYDKYNKIFKNCSDICFRETYSYNLFKQLPNVRLAPDIVFQLKEREIPKRKNTVGFSLIDLENRNNLKKFSDQYLNKMFDLIKSYIDSGKSITLFSFCESEGDMDVINKIMNRMTVDYLNKMNVINYTGNINEFLNEFKSMEVIIGSRFHSIILAQVFKQGFYPIIYSDKTYNVLQDIKLDEYYKYIKDIDSLNVNHVIDVAQNNRINDTEFFRDSENHFRFLDDFINRNMINEQ